LAGTSDSDAQLAAAAERLERSGSRRRRSPAVFWRRRLIVVAILVVLAVVIWLRFFHPANTDFAGTWAGSQALLGSSTLVFKKDGATYRIKGLAIDGKPAAETHIDDGKLYATGQSNGRTWTVRFEIGSDGRQLWAYYDRGAGQPELRLRLNRVSD
jgi:hypothetical protein